jgi:hypothetical protein
VLPLVVVSGCLVAWARSPSVILHPRLYAEDGAIFFHAAYSQGWHAPLSQTYAGYLQTFSRLVADVGLLVPLSRVPLLFAVIALVVQVLPAVMVASRRFGRAVPDLRVRLLLAAVYLVIPNSSEVNVVLTNAQWHLAILAVLVVLAMPATGAWRVFDLAAMVLSGLTGPFVLSVIVIAAIVYYYRRQGWTLAVGVVALTTGAIQLFELLHAQRPHVGPLGATASRFTEILGGRLIGNTVLGTSTTTSGRFVTHLLAFSVLFLVGALVVVGCALWRGPFELKMFNLWAGLTLAGSLASPLASAHGYQWQMLVGNAGDRYWLFPSLAFVADLIWLAGQIRTPWRIPAASAVALLVVFAAFGVREDFRYPIVPAPGWQAQVRQFDRLAPGQSFTFHIRPPGWTMTLTKK